MAAETQFTANTALGAVSTANSNLDGTGTLSLILTAGAYGTLIKTVTIKARGDTTNGMVRFFIYDGSNKRLISEVEIPAVTKSSTDPTFTITIPADFALKSGWKLYASTEKSETFNIIAEGLDWTYYGSSVRYECTKFTGNTGIKTISTANSNLNGTGTIYTVLTAASNGTTIQSVVIKAQVTTSQGMVRLFLYDGDSITMLLKEIPVPAVTKSGTAHSFSHKVDFNGKGFALTSGYSLKATTENGESFNIIAEGLDWTYPA